MAAYVVRAAQVGITTLLPVGRVAGLYALGLKPKYIGNP